MNRDDTVHFALRRVHSLLGIIPLGLFLFEHFLINAFALSGREAFNTKVEFLHSLPYLLLLEVGFIFVPFLLHALYGLVIIYGGGANVGNYGYGRNWLYFFQRVSAFFVLGFVIYHVFTLRFMINPHEVDLYEVMAETFQNPFFVALYALGVCATVFHFWNGIATFCMTWGITVGPNSQRWVGYACILGGLAMAAVGINVIWAFNIEQISALPDPHASAEMVRESLRSLMANVSPTL